MIKPLPVLLCLLLKTTAFGADPTITRAVERSILLMEKSIATYVEARDCFTCHHQALPIMTLSQARRSGFSVAQKTFTTQTRFTLEYFSDRQDRLPKGEGVPGGPYTAGYALAQLQATQEPANSTSKALISYLLKTQKPDGSWRIRTHRPPLEDSHFTATALGIKAMINSEPAKKAAQWIAQAQPKTTEDHVFKVLGLHWADRQKESQAAAKVLLKLQDEEGGWAQLTTMKSDAYATGQALTALNKCGLRGQKVDIEDPEKPGQVTTVDTSTTDIKRSMDDPDELEIVHKGKDMVQKGFNKGDASSPSKGIKVGQKVKMENDDIEDMVAPEFEKIIHMLKQGMSPEDIKAKMPKQADVVDQVVKDLTAVTEAMNAVLPEGTSLSGTELAALRLLVGTSEFMRAKRAIEFARAGRAIPSDLVAGLKPLFDKIGTFLSAGAGAVKRFGDIEKMIGRSVQKNDAYEDKLSSKLQIKESEMSKAEVALAAKDMVDKVDAMLQDVSQMKGEDLLPLTDKVRDEIGQEASDSLKTSVEGSLGELETALQSARTALDNAARTVAGDPSASAGDMGADPMADPTMPDPTNPDELNTLDVADPEIGGEEPEGREKRESVERTKHQIAENIFKTLAGKNKV